MTRTQLLAPTKGKPFHPFEIHTTGGETYTVTHPEQYWVSPKGETILVYLADVIAFIDSDHIANFARLIGKDPRK
jgi:hypothetical protein